VPRRRSARRPRAPPRGRDRRGGTSRRSRPRTGSCRRRRSPSRGSSAAAPIVVGHDVEERRQGVQRAGRHHDDVYAVLRGAGRRRPVERRRRQREFFLSRPRLRVLGSDGRGGASTAAAAVRWSRGVASVPWGRSRGARAQTFLAGHLQLRVLRAPQEATRRDRRARRARIRIQSLLLREWRHSESPRVSSCEPQAAAAPKILANRQQFRAISRGWWDPETPCRAGSDPGLVCLLVSYDR
jgi:hypothetical protein